MGGGTNTFFISSGPIESVILFSPEKKRVLKRISN